MEAGRWVVAGTFLADPYPCLCAPPCRERGASTCPCFGRYAQPHLPAHCCAIQRVRAGLAPWARRW
jgi:hypothetical protein